MHLSTLSWHPWDSFMPVDEARVSQGDELVPFPLLVPDHGRHVIAGRGAGLVVRDMIQDARMSGEPLQLVAESGAQCRAGGPLHHCISVQAQMGEYGAVDPSDRGWQDILSWVTRRTSVPWISWATLLVIPRIQPDPHDAGRMICASTDKKFIQEILEMADAAGVRTVIACKKTMVALSLVGITYEYEERQVTLTAGQDGSKNMSTDEHWKIGGISPASMIITKITNETAVTISAIAKMIGSVMHCPVATDVLDHMKNDEAIVWNAIENRTGLAQGITEHK